MIEAERREAAYWAELGRRAFHGGMAAQARSAWRFAAALTPGDAAAPTHIGLLCVQAGDIDGALAWLARARRLDPASAPTLANLGRVLHVGNRLAAARAALAAAATLAPGDGAIAAFLGQCLADADLYSDAVRWCRRAIAVHPANGEAWLTQGSALAETGNAAAGAQAARIAHLLRPEHLRTLKLLTNIELWHRGDPNALSRARRAVACAPDDAEAELLMAYGLLARGRLVEGWQRYRVRVRTRGTSWPPSGLPAEEWRGQDVSTGAGPRGLVIQREQGIGDELMYATCYRDAIARAGEAAIVTDPRFVTLFQRSFPAARVLADPAAADDGLRTRAAFIGAADLPSLLRRTPAAFPANGAYLVPDPARLGMWRARLAGLGEGLKVGISWRSTRAKTAARPVTYPALAHWAPLFAVPGIHVVSLQFDDDPAERARAAAAGLPIEAMDGLDLTNDMEGIAALIGALDLVVSVRNTLEGLAGGVGTPLWCVVPVRPWTALGTDRQPFFPTERLWRRDLFGGWDALFAALARELSAGYPAPRP